MSPDDVEFLQRSLNKLMNAGLTIDGTYGPQTKNAVISFQRQCGIATDGIAGPNTEKALEDALAQRDGPLISWFKRVFNTY